MPDQQLATDTDGSTLARKIDTLSQALSETNRLLIDNMNLLRATALAQEASEGRAVVHDMRLTQVEKRLDALEAQAAQ